MNLNLPTKAYNVRETRDDMEAVSYICAITHNGIVARGEAGRENKAIELAEQNYQELLDNSFTPQAPNWENSVESFLCKN